MVANHDFRIIFEKFDLGFKYFGAVSLRVGIILSISGLESKYFFGISAPGWPLWHSPRIKSNTALLVFHSPHPAQPS